MFSKYNKIPNLKNGIAIRHPGKYVATEKVHGANFAFYILPDGLIKCAKRSAFLDNENFFNHHQLEPMQSVIRKISEYIRLNYPEYFILTDSVVKTDPVGSVLTTECENTIIIYGEIFGGIYNDVSNFKPVQTGVQYTPDIKFYAFDIKINNKFLTYKIFENICGRFDLLYAKPLCKGFLNELLQLDPNFQSTIPEQLGLPSISNNIAEGYVIKPVNRVLNNRGRRIIWKLKSDKFSENKPKPVPKLNSDNSDLQDMFEILFPMISKNRLDNILSHGPVLPVGHEQEFLVGNLIKDAMSESPFYLVSTDIQTPASGLAKTIKTNIKKRLIRMLTPEALKIVNNSTIEFNHE